MATVWPSTTRTATALPSSRGRRRRGPRREDGDGAVVGAEMAMARLSTRGGDDVALDEGMTTACRSERRSTLRRADNGNTTGTSRLDLGYDGPCLSGLCVVTLAEIPLNQQRTVEMT
jgi:hypothetical protein